jgi:hypothetical protein
MANVHLLDSPLHKSQGNNMHITITLTTLMGHPQSKQLAAVM